MKYLLLILIVFAQVFLFNCNDNYHDKYGNLRVKQADTPLDSVIKNANAGDTIFFVPVHDTIYIRDTFIIKQYK